MHYEFRQKDVFHISTDPQLLNINLIHQWLAQDSYWAKGIPFETVARSIANSCCFGIYTKEAQVGFARVVTDYATFGYLCDVFIDPACRGKGLSKWLMQVIDEHPSLQGFRSWMLGTKDAHGLYSQFGYEAHPEPHRLMRRYRPYPVA